MKKYGRRILSALLVLVMILSVLPAAAFADSGDTVSLNLTCKPRSPSGDLERAVATIFAKATITDSGELRFKPVDNKTKEPNLQTAISYGKLTSTSNIRVTYNGVDTGLTGEVVEDEFVVKGSDLLTNDWSGKLLRAEIVFQEYTYTVSLNGQPTATGLWHDATYSLPEVPVISGKQAIGWSFGGRTYQAGSNFSLSTAINQLPHGITEINFVPVYKDVKDYLVLWVDSITGEIYDYETVVAGETAAAVADPAKAGYAFGGWDKTTTDPITENTVFYAQWTAQDYGITYGALTTGTQTTANTGDTVNVTTNPREGYQIDGIYVKGASGTYYTVNPTVNANGYQFTMPAESVTVWATETASRLTATFRVDGSVTETQSLDYGTAPAAPRNPTKLGYTFQGWKAQSDDTVYTPGAALAALTANEVYDAVFEADGYTLVYARGAQADASDSKCYLTLAAGVVVEFYNDDALGEKGTYPENGTFNVGDTVTLAEPMLPGYKFLGWQDASGYIHPAGAKFTMPAADVKLTALWEEDETQSVLVRFMSQGSLYDAFLAYEGDTAQVPAQDPVVPGKIFGGWSDGNDIYSNQGVKKFTVTSNGTREMVLEAQWTDESYTVTYNVDGAMDTVQDLTYGQEITLKAAPAKEGYTFQAWQSNSGAYYLAGSAYTVKADTLFTAVWSEDSADYVVKFLDANGSLFDLEIVTAGTDITAPVYTLGEPNDVYRWEGGNRFYESGDTITVDSDMVFRAVRTVQKKYNVTVGVTPNTVVNATTLASPAYAKGETGVMTVQVPDGYTLKGVAALAADGTAVPDNLIPNADGTYTYRFTMPGSDLTIQVAFEEIPADSTVVKFFSDGNLYDYIIVEKGTEANAPATLPVKEGSTFHGWVRGSETLQPGDLFLVADNAPAEIVYTAQWDVNTYLVQYDSNGGDTTPTAENKAYGEQITLADAPNRNGYTFIGWVEESTGFLYSAGASYTVKNDAKFTARWEVGKCVVRFLDPNTGVIYGYENVDQGTRVLAPAEPQVSGKTFLYWQNKADAADQVAASTMTAEVYGDTVYEAVFETSSHSITVSAQLCTVTPAAFPATQVGEDVTFTVAADAGYAVDSVVISYVDGTSLVVRELTQQNGTYSFKMPDADVTISAIAVQNVFSVFTDPDAHAVITLQTPNKAEVGSVVRFLAESDDPAYKISVIAVHTDGTEKPLPFALNTDGVYEFVMPAEDVKISVRTQRAQHTVTFLDSDNTLLGIVPVDSGDMVTPVADPVRKGYTFDHWELLPGKTPFDPAATPVKTDLVLRAVYTGEVYKVSKGLGDHVAVLQANSTLSNGNVNSSNLLQTSLQAETGKTVYFTVAAERDYTVTDVCVVSANGTDLVVEPTLREQRTVGESIYYTYAFTMPAEDVKIDVYTAAKSFKVTVEENLPLGGTYTINGYTSTNRMIPQGEEVTIAVMPAEGYVVKNVTGTYVDSEGNTAQLSGTFDPNLCTYVFTMISRDVTIHIEYEANTYGINVSDSNSESYKPDTSVKPIGPAENLDENFTSKGRITLTGVANVMTGDGLGNFWEIPGDGEAKVGTHVSFRVEEFTGYRLVSVRVTYANGEKSCNVTAKNGTYFFDMPADDVVITAEFEKVSNYVAKAASAESHGTVTIGGLRENRVSVEYKDLVEVVVTPNAGYQVKKISYVLTDDTVADFDAAQFLATSTLIDVLDTDHSISFHMPATDVTVNVEYAPIDYTISDTSENATTTYTTPQNVGNTVKFTVKPDTGYVVSKVYAETADGETIYIHTSSVNPLYGADYVFTMPAAAVEIYVETIKDQYNVKYLDNGTLVGFEDVDYMDTANVSQFVSAVSNGKPGYHFVGWTSNDVKNPVLVPSVNDADFQIIGATVIQAAYEKDQIYVHFLPTENGTVTELSTNSDAEYVLSTTVFGDVVRFAVAPQEGYVVDQVRVSTTDQDGFDTQIGCTVSGSTYTFRIPATYKNSVHDVRAEDVKVQVTFKKAVYRLTEDAASQHDGTIAINGVVTTQTSFSYNYADQVTIAATPKDGYYVKSIVAANADGSERFEILGTKPTADTKAGEILTLRFNMPACDLTYKVCFEKIDYTITTKFDQTQGTVTTDPADSATLGELVKVDVAPKEGYILKNLTVTYDGGRQSCNLTKIGENSFSFVMPAQAVIVTAEFAEQTYLATLETQGEGTVTLNGYYTDNMTADYLDTVTVNVTPAEGWQLKSILVDDGKVSLNEAIRAEGGNYTFTMPNRDVRVRVVLAKIDYTLTAYAINFFENGHGKVTLNVPGTANAGDRITITADPDDGYRVKKVVVQDANQNSVPVSYVTGAADYTETWSFTMPASAVEVTVLFEVYGSSYYKDVRTDHWFFDAVTFVTDRGYFYGVSDELFGPHIDMNRAMFVTVLGRISNVDVSLYQKKSFTDVPSKSYYAPYVSWAAENGIVYGRSATEFDPNASITRQEMAAIMYRYCKFLGLDMTPENRAFMSRYTDTGKISAWAKDSMEWAVGAGLILGTSSTTIDPMSHATRAQVAQVIKNLCDKVLYN